MAVTLKDFPAVPRGAVPRDNDHALRQVVVLAALRHLPGEVRIVSVEAGRIRDEGPVAGADLPPAVFHDGAHRQAIVMRELPAHREGLCLRPAAVPGVNGDAAHASPSSSESLPAWMAGMARRMVSWSQSHQRRARNRAMVSSSKRLRMGFAGAPPTIV